jgi:hypothetical protein
VGSEKSYRFGQYRLLTERGQAFDLLINEDFQPDDVQAREIMEICRHLDVGKIFV